MHLLADEPKKQQVIVKQVETLTNALRSLLVLPDLRFVYDKTDYSLKMVANGKELLREHLAAGHQAVLRIVADLYTRVNAVDGRAFESGGVVLLDEPELHLHPEMQERVLPGLTALFPNLQFIVATHAPACISSIDDAWVYDLREGEGLPSEDLRGRPYGSLMMSHFRVPSDYDLRTTAAVDKLLAQGQAGPTSIEDKRALRDALGAYLTTKDARVLATWSRLSMELDEG